MSDSAILSAGFCAPILWGVRQGYSIEEIAVGLGIDNRTVMRAIELHSGIEFPDLQSLPRVDVARIDSKYLAWRRAHEGAARALDAIARGGHAHGCAR